MEPVQRFDTTNIRTAIENYLSLLNGKPKVDIGSYRALAIALDRLVIEYHISKDVNPSDAELDAPRESGPDTYKLVAETFPELGYYPIVDPTDDLNAEILLADAIDDLADISIDLQEVLWHFDQGHIEDGIWYFRWGYQNHWGTHLHRLRVLLHSSKVAAW